MKKFWPHVLLGTVASFLFIACPLQLAPPDPLGPPQIHKVNKPDNPELRKRQEKARDKEKFQRMKRVFLSDDEQSCKRDDECTITNYHCCSCMGNGRQVGVRKDRLKSVMARRVHLCDEMVCPQMVSGDPSCKATRALCKQGQCVIDPASAPANKPPQGIGVEDIPPEK
jgi:hypothetical protein